MPYVRYLGIGGIIQSDSKDPNGRPRGTYRPFRIRDPSAVNLIEELSFGEDQADETTMSQLSDLPNIRSLSLAGTVVNDSCLQAIARGSTFGN